MDAKSKKTISKNLSYVLRHQPDSIGISLDTAGWVNVEALLAAFARDGRPLSRELLEQIVAESDKQRYELSLDGLRIRARQGHSVEVITCEPPARPAMAHRTVKNTLARVTQVSTAADE